MIGQRIRKSYRKGPNVAETRLQVAACHAGVVVTRRGYPDYAILAKDGEIIGFIEVKPTDKCNLKKGQQAFRRLCERYGIPFAQWCPTDPLPDFTKVRGNA